MIQMIKYVFSMFYWQPWFIIMLLIICGPMAYLKIYGMNIFIFLVSSLSENWTKNSILVLIRYLALGGGGVGGRLDTYISSPHDYVTLYDGVLSYGQ